MVQEITITVDQQDAIKAGELLCGRQTLTIDSWDGWSSDERAVLAGLVAGGPVRLEAATVDALRQRCRDKVAQQALEAAEEEKQLVGLRAYVEKEGAAIMLRSSTVYGGRCSVCDHWHSERRVWSVSAYVYVPGYTACVPRLPSDLVKLATIERDRLNASEAEAAGSACSEHEAACVLEQRAQADAKEAKRVEYGGLLREALTREQTARHDAGYLPDKEARHAIRNLVFSDFDDRARFVPLTYDDLDHHPECCNSDVGYVVEKAETLTAAQYAAVLSIEEVTETITHRGGNTRGNVQPMIHTAQCNCEAEQTRYGIEVVLTLPAGNEFSREFALADGNNK